MKNLNKIVDVILLLPTVVWSLIGIINIFKTVYMVTHLYSYSPSKSI